MLHRSLAAVDKYVETRDGLYLVRAQRYAGFLRAHAAPQHLRKVVDAYVTDAGRKAELLDMLSAALAGRTDKVRRAVWAAAAVLRVLTGARVLVRPRRRRSARLAPCRPRPARSPAGTLLPTPHSPIRRHQRRRARQEERARTVTWT